MGVAADQLSGVERRARLERARLYFVCEAHPGGRDAASLVRAALAGGADIVQLRDRELDDTGLMAAAGLFRELCGAHGALFVLNDRPDLAARCGADGVHLGQEDTPVAEARGIVGPDALIGLSTHSLEQIEAADGVDYISVGPVFETPTKPGRGAVGLELVEIAEQLATVPFFAIGGIDPSNAGRVIAAGAQRLAVVRAIRDAEHPRAAAEALRTAAEAHESI
jgi:thiamine-phosphate pyrophosphorylase